jgi:hypothetical protein
MLAFILYLLLLTSKTFRKITAQGLCTMVILDKDFTTC